jgi:hypothetical protein
VIRILRDIGFESLPSAIILATVLLFFPQSLCDDHGRFLTDASRFIIQNHFSITSSTLHNLSVDTTSYSNPGNRYNGRAE